MSASFRHRAISRRQSSWRLRPPATCGEAAKIAARAVAGVTMLWTVGGRAESEAVCDIASIRTRSLAMCSCRFATRERPASDSLSRRHAEGCPFDTGTRADDVKAAESAAAFAPMHVSSYTYLHDGSKVGVSSIDSKLIHAVAMLLPCQRSRHPNSVSKIRATTQVSDRAGDTAITLSHQTPR